MPKGGAIPCHFGKAALHCEPYLAEDCKDVLHLINALLELPA